MLKVFQRNIKYIIPFILCLFSLVQFSNSLSCDKIAYLPNDLETLLPNYRKLTRGHISNNFFIEEREGKKEITFTMEIKTKSVLKIQITPHHCRMKIDISSPAFTKKFKSSSGVPIDYTVLDSNDLFEGVLTITIHDFMEEQDTMNQEVKEYMTTDTYCSIPYMLLEIYFEEYSFYLERVEEMRASLKDLKDFSSDFWNVFKDLEKAEIKVKTNDKIVQKITRDITPYKLEVKDTINFYENKYSLYVLEQFELEVPEDKLNMISKKKKVENEYQMTTKYFIKIQMYSDFLIGGGLHFLIVNQNSMKSLANLTCLYDGKCIISERRSKNAMILEAILTPGKYKILLINMHTNSDNFRKFLNLKYIPVSAGIKIKNIKSTENSFQCVGRRLPITFDHLLNLNRNYFEYKGKIIFNMQNLKDEVYLTVPQNEDYILRITAYFTEGNNIKIKLIEIDPEKLRNKPFSQSQNDYEGSNMDNSTTELNDTLYSQMVEEVINSDDNLEVVSESKSWGSQSSLYTILNQGKYYLILFDYSESFFSQYNRKSCEIFYLKLALSSMTEVTRKYPKAFDFSENCQINFEEIEKFIRDFNDQHSRTEYYVNDEYQLISKDIYSYNDIFQEKEINIIYYKVVNILSDISFYFQVICDFTTSSVIPIILPYEEGEGTNVEELLMKHDMKKLLLHKGTINMKLQKGKYILVLIHGLTQYNGENEENDYYNEVMIPKCVTFKLKVNTILLNKKKLLNWPCNFDRFHHIPSDIDLTDNKDKYYYFNHHMLVPIERQIIKIKTNDVKYFLRLRVQFPTPEDVDSMSVSIKKNGKTLLRAKKEIFEDGKNPLIYYLNYILDTYTEYEIHFSNNFKEFAKFFDKCRMFTLDLLVTNPTANSSPNIKCLKKIPNITNVIFERTIDVDNSFEEYKSDLLNKWLSVMINKKDSKKKNIRLNPNLSLFRFKFDKNEEMEYPFEFEINDPLSRVSLLIETPYALPIEVSAKLYFLKPGKKGDKIYTELIGTQEIEDENILSLRDVLLTSGKYKIVVGVNKKMYNSKVLELLSSFCVEFTASLIIENKQFEFGQKGAFKRAENCPYNEFPNDLNIPGWIYSDTGYSINTLQRFKVKNSRMSKTFTVHKKSLFKFFLPDTDNVNFHNQIKLSLDKNNRETELIHSLGKNDNFITEILEKGSYLLEFSFELALSLSFYNRDKNEYDHMCNFFDVEISLQPIEDIYNDIYENCYSDFSAINIMPQSSLLYIPIKFQSVYEEGPKLINTMKIPPNQESKSRFRLEVIYNTYIDSLHSFDLYRIDPITNEKFEVVTEYSMSGNFIWVVFNMEKGIEYEIRWMSAGFKDFKTCSKVMISYNYANQLATDEVSTQNNCEVTDRLPSNFFDNSNGQLTPYGKGQRTSNGEMYFYGKFLLPKSSNTIRSEFLIKEDSILFIQVLPLYKTNRNNIFIEIYRGNNRVGSFVNNRANEIEVIYLSDKEYYSEEETNFLNYYLDLTFDQTLSKCESYTFLFSIIPFKAYKNIYLNCENVEEDSDKENIPNYLDMYKTNNYLFSSHVKKEFVLNEESNYQKIINLNVSVPMSLEIDLSYIHSDNLMDISLYTENNAIYKLGVQSIESGHVNGIHVHKVISINLKPGEYKLKLVFHSIFLTYLEKIFTEDEDVFNLLCFPFDLGITTTPLNLQDNKSENDDYENEDIEIKKITKKDYERNALLKIRPNGANNLRIGNKLDIELSFAYDFISSTQQIQKYKQIIYLQEYEKNNYYSSYGYYNSNSDNNSGKKIYPSYVADYRSDSLVLTFELKENNFQIKKCYKLYYNQSSADNIDDYIISKTDIVYCMMKCECNPMSSYSCSLNGKCRCKDPYKGDKCDKCIDGYIFTSSGNCINERFTNLKCSDKQTCNDNGNCIIPGSSYDPYDRNLKNPCICQTGFETIKGYPLSSFCNKCSNPNKFYPFCYDKNSGSESKDRLKFSWNTHCSDFQRAPSLPVKFFNLNFEKKQKNMQNLDGSIKYNAVLKVKDDEEFSEILITEDSIIRVLFISREINKAKIELLSKWDSKEPIAETEGLSNSESFIARLKRRNAPYILKISHYSLKSSCNRYQIKMSILPVALVKTSLECNVNENDLLSSLPPSELTISDDTSMKLADKWFNVPDSLILSKSNFENETSFNKNDKIMRAYNVQGLISKKKIGEPFEYNIKINVNYPITFSVIAKYKFLSNDVLLKLRNSNGEVIKSGTWITSDLNDQIDNFYSGIEDILEPGTYYLTIIENVSVNHLTQMFYLMSKSKTEGHKCYKFMLNIQTTRIEKIEKGFYGDNYELNYNRLMSVEPFLKSNLNRKKKLYIYASFESTLKTKMKKIEGKNLSLIDAFYLENVDDRRIVKPKHVYINGQKNKRYQIIFNENTLDENQCYILKYDFSMIESLNSNQIVLSDEPIVHKYCTKLCNCNPMTDFSCLEDNKCLCKLPYTGDQCMQCIEGYYFSKDFTCISQESCDYLMCNGNGKCRSSTNGNETTINCECNKNYAGKECNKCSNNKKIYPDCSYEPIDDKAKNKTTNKQEEGKKLFNERVSRTENDCKHQFLPYDLDTLGYLHLDGNMHISGKYSIKPLNKKNYIMTFTFKEDSHMKIYIEHSEKSHIVEIYLLDEEKKVILSGDNSFGPAGEDTSTILDFIAGPGRYYAVFYAKEITSIGAESKISYGDLLNDLDSENVEQECFTVFMELEAKTLKREKEIINGFMDEDKTCQGDKIDKAPELIPKNMTVYDFQSKYYNELAKGITGKYYHFRYHLDLGNNDYHNNRFDFSNPEKDQFDLDKKTNVNYFHYEYIYIPDYVDQQFSIELDLNSKFLNSEIGVLLEIVELPESLREKSEKLSNDKINQYLGETENQIKKPLCEIHCYTGIKKYNSVVLSRVLPSDTFFRIWFYDISPSPAILSSSINYSPNTCILYQTTLVINSIKADQDALNKQISSSLCQSNELPTDLNNKEYLGNSKYIKRFGFHILDKFRVDRVAKKYSRHVTLFEITTAHLYRIVIEPGKVDIDLNLYIRHQMDENKYKDILIAKSSSKNFESVICIELPPGKYKMVFKFYPPPTGYQKCESIKIEFAMESLENIQKDIDKMIKSYNDKVPEFKEINILSHIQNSKEIYSKGLELTTYGFSTPPPFVINYDDIKQYKASFIISNLTFEIKEEDNKKIQLNAYAESDFLFFDCGIYLVYNGPNGEKKILTSIHRKNLNTLITHKLQSGIYKLSIRYYRRLHYRYPKNYKNFKGIDLSEINQSLMNDTMGQLHFDVQMVNVADEKVKIETSSGVLELKPQSSQKISYNHLCRKYGIPVPKSLTSYRYLGFSLETHILDNFLLPPTGTGQDVIEFQVKRFPSAMIRVYVESSEVKIGIILRKKKLNGKYEILSESKNNVHFETVMALLDSKSEYEIVIMYKGFIDKSILQSDNNQCKTFKMEIAIEKNHNYACPEQTEFNYISLNKLNPIPSEVPVKFSKTEDVYKYNSRNFYSGEDNNQGYVFMKREVNDTSIKFSKFEVTKPIDFKFEVFNDFLQAPVTIMLVSSNREVNLDDSNKNNYVSELINNTLKLDSKSFIISYGEIFEGRTSLLVKNLPIGQYLLYIYLPGLKSKFSDKNVCSIYDIEVEIKKSRNHFRDKEIISTTDMKEDNLDIPVHVPFSLNNPRFMSGYGKFTYINYHSNYFFRLNETFKANNSYNKINTLPFTLATDSLVYFEVNQNEDESSLVCSIENISNFSKRDYQVLKPGDYKLVIKLSQNQTILDDHNKSIDTLVSFNKNSYNKLIKFYVGISPTNRLEQIYDYNNIQLTYRQCVTSYLPKFSFKGKEKDIRYSNDKFMVRPDDIRETGLIQSVEVDLTKSSKNRFIAELGTDRLLNKVTMSIIAGRRKYIMKFNGNHGYLDLILPTGKYLLNLTLDNKMIIENSCLLMSINIHIINSDINYYTNDIFSQLVRDDMSKENLLRPKCDGNIIPLEILTDTDVPSERINKNGDYVNHLENALYFTHYQKSKSQKNINEVDINVQKDSLLHITTKTLSSKFSNIIPRIKYGFSKEKENVFYKNPRISLISPNKRERNTFFRLQQNNNSLDDYYTLELQLEQDSADMNLMNTNFLLECPKYDLDIIIADIKKLHEKYNCVKKDGKIYKVKKPKKNIKFDQDEESYKEKLLSSYFTEDEYAKLIVNNEFYSGMVYKINIELGTSDDNSNFFIKADVGYQHGVSLFDLLLMDEDNNLISFSSTIFNKEKKVFKYHRILQSNVNSGNYTLLIYEYSWTNMTTWIKGQAEKSKRKDVYLCLPFSYSLEIVPATEDALPMVVSVFPPGPIINRDLTHDLIIKIVLNREPYTSKQLPITSMYNTAQIARSFIIREKGNDDAPKIQPEKVIGNENGKEWELLYSSSKIDPEKDYEFIFIEGWLFDNFMASFDKMEEEITIKTTWAQKPESIMDTQDVIEENTNIMISAIDLSGQDIEEERPSFAEDISRQDIDNDARCNGHGTYIYHNLLQKYICSCIDGFTGKFCDYCEGKIIAGKCVEVDSGFTKDYDITPGEENKNNDTTIPSEPSSQNTEESTVKNDSEVNPSIPQNEQPKIDTNEKQEVTIKCQYECIHGICDTKVGICICDKDFTGKDCSTKKKSTGRGEEFDVQEINVEVEKNKIGNRLKRIFNRYLKGIIKKLLIILVCIVLFLYLIRCALRRNKKSDYEALGQFEPDFDISSTKKGTINSTNNEHIDEGNNLKVEEDQFSFE